MGESLKNIAPGTRLPAPDAVDNPRISREFRVYDQNMAG